MEVLIHKEWSASARAVFRRQLEQRLEQWPLGVELEQRAHEHEQQHRVPLRLARRVSEGKKEIVRVCVGITG